MADYWKSNPRKFCDTCKCWFADNRSSIDFHERGKRHQEAVKQRLADLARKGRDDHLQQQRLHDDMKHMEEAAMAALKKDIRNNPAMARQYGVTLGNKSSQAPAPGGAGDAADKRATPASEPPSPGLDGVPLPAEAGEPEQKWHEAKSEQGYSYYWHIETGETVWEPPKEGYVPLPDTAPEEKDNTSDVSNLPDTAKRSPRRDSNSSPERSPSPGRESDGEPPPPAEVMGPANRPVRADPYGSKWEVVPKSEPAGPVDLQLPEQRLPKVQPSVAREKPRIVFRQKTVGSLGGPAGETFKRRAAEGEKKRRNIRQRTDD